MKENLEVQQAENKIYYSKSTNGFYFSSVNTEIPIDKVEITQEHYKYLMSKQDNGMLILADKNNNPIAVTQPLNEEFRWDEVQCKWVIDDKFKTQALANAKQNGVAQIDDLVGSIYLKFTRFDKEYQRREDQAKAFKANGYKGEVPLQVNAFASNVGISPQQATDIILAQAEKLNHALDILGELRMKKYQINQQETIEDVQKVTKQLIDEIQKVGGQL